MQNKPARMKTVIRFSIADDMIQPRIIPPYAMQCFVIRHISDIRRCVNRLICDEFRSERKDHIAGQTIISDQPRRKKNHACQTTERESRTQRGGAQGR